MACPVTLWTMKSEWSLDARSYVLENVSGVGWCGVDAAILEVVGVVFSLDPLLTGMVSCSRFVAHGDAETDHLTLYACVCSCDDRYYTAASGKVPIRWTAPEAVARRKFNTKTDLWAFGVVMHEIWTNGDRPYGHWSNFQVQMEVMAGYRLPRTRGCPKSVYMIMQACWQAEQRDRPYFDSILGMLESTFLAHNLEDPSFPELFEKTQFKAKPDRKGII